MKLDTTKKLWIGLAILIVLTPLGLLATGTAWGEWSPDELEGVDYIPQGMQKLSDFWHSLLPDYNVPGWENSFALSSIGYILSAIIGIGIITAIIFALGKFLASEEEG
ncbi:MAG: PDGLE domain-containing protein [Methanosarcinales archaeon]